MLLQPVSRARRRAVRAALAAIAGAVLFACAACAAPATSGHSAQGGGATGSEEGAAEEDSRPLVLATFTVIADIAQNVAGEHLRVESLTKPGAEIHGYEPTPGDLRRANEAVLILDNGMGLEAWFEQFVAHFDVPHVTVSEGIDPIDITDDAYAGHPNPHAWMSPLNVQLYAENMAEAFAELDPQHAEVYEANAVAYSGLLQQSHDEMIEQLAAVPEQQRVLVSCEGAFSYLARDAGLTEAYIWPVNAERQATPQRIADVINFVREHEVPAVFCESTVSDASMQRVVESTSARFGGALYVDSLSEADGPVPSYLDLVRHNSELIVAGLAGS